MNLKNERRDPTIIENGTSAIFKSQFMYYITITHIMSSVVCVCVDMCTRVLGGGGVRISKWFESRLHVKNWNPEEGGIKPQKP